MEKFYIKTAASEIKSKLMADKLEMSPNDKYKAKYGELNQANYLVMAKGNSAKKQLARSLYEDKEISEEQRDKMQQ